MKLRGRTLLVIALLLFGGYAIYDYYQDKGKEATKQEQSRLLTVNFDQIDQVVIQNTASKDKGAERILLKRSVDGWNLEEPIKDLADNTAVEDLVRGTASESIIEVANSGSNIDWSMYGLDKPAGTISFVTTAGPKNVFAISGKRNFEENVFARRDSEQRVLVMNSVWQTRVNKGVNDFRDHRVLRHKMAAIDSLHLKNSAGELSLLLKDGKWISAGHKDLPLNQNKVRETLQGIADAKISEYVEALPELKSLFILDLKLGEKSWTAEVGQAKDFKVYAKVSDSGYNTKFNLKLEAGAFDKLIKLGIEDLKEGAPSKDNDSKDLLSGDAPKKAPKKAPEKKEKK